MAWTIPSNAVSGTTILAATTNAIIADLVVIGGAWTSYTPVFTNITKGNAVLSYAFLQTNHSCKVRGLFQAGSTTTYSAGNLGISLPTSATPHADYTAVANGEWPVGTAVAAFTTGATKYSCTAIITSTGILNFLVDNPAPATNVTNLLPSAFGTASSLAFTVEYETT